MPASAETIAAERMALMRVMDTHPYKIPSRKLNENLLIATWNIEQFSNRHTNRAIQYIADICERFDIIALQEVKTDLRGLERLQRMLPGNYRILVSDPTGNHERFAFLYDKRSVYPTGLASDIGFNVPAKTHMGYQLHRMPYCASFRAERFDFVIATAHIYYGRTKAERDQRREEIQQMVDFIHRRTRAGRGKVFDRDFFVVGDLNVEKHDDPFFDALVSRGFQMPDGMNSLTTNFGRSKTFDKIAWVNRKQFRHTGEFNVVPFYKALFQDMNPKGGNAEISDHLPLWAEFEINSLTQELDQILNPGH